MVKAMDGLKIDDSGESCYFYIATVKGNPTLLSWHTFLVTLTFYHSAIFNNIKLIKIIFKILELMLQKPSSLLDF